jgi:hypothetical protein
MRLDALFGEVFRNEITFFAMHLCDISSVVCVY